MDSEYFIRVIIEGRDNLSRSLASAAEKLREFRAEAQKADVDLERTGKRFDSTAHGGENLAAANRKVAQSEKTLSSEINQGVQNRSRVTKAESDLEAARLKHTSATSKLGLAEQNLERIRVKEDATAEQIERAENKVRDARVRSIATGNSLREMERGLAAARGGEVNRLSDLERAQKKLTVAQAQHQNLLRRLPADNERVAQSQVRLENAYRNVEKAERDAGVASGTVEAGLGRVRNASQGAANATERYKNEFKAAGIEIESVQTRFTRTAEQARRGTNAWSNSLRGIQRSLFDTRRGVRDMDATMRSLQGRGFEAFYNITRGADNAAKSFFRMNTIMSFLAPLIFTVVTAVLNLGAALVAVASAAAMAAAALGGALLSGIVQLVPVVGLLIAAFHRLSLVMQASQMLSKGTASSHKSAADAARTHREAVQRLADAQYGLSQAYQGVRDSALRVKDAEKQLVEARRNAARDLVDLQNQRRDAILSEKDAELSLLEAKQRLKEIEQERSAQSRSLEERQGAVREAQQRLQIAEQQGDQGEIFQATQQLDIAKQNLSGAQGGATDQNIQYQRAQLEVLQAEQRIKEAVIARKRAIEDAARAEKLGVEGAKQVVDAQRAIRDAIRAQAEAMHSLAHAQREVLDAAHDVRHPTATATATGGESNPYKALIKRLDPTERDLLQIIEHFKKLWNKATGPLTDAILRAIGKALQQAETLFRDAKFMGALQNLANVIGDQIVRLAKFFTSGEQKKFFEEMAKLAEKTTPKIVTMFLQLVRLVERIAVAFAPVFNHIIDATSKFLARETAKGDQPAKAPKGFPQNKLGAFAAKSETYLDAVAHFFGAVLNFLGAIIGVAAPSGKSALEGMTDALNGWAKALRTTDKAGAKRFFEESIHVAGLFLKLIGNLLEILFKSTQTKGFEDFIKVLSGPGTKALGDVAFVYGRIFSLLAKIAAQPGLGKVIEYLGALYLLSKITPIGFVAQKVGGKALGALLGTGVPEVKQLTAAEMQIRAAELQLAAAGKGGEGGGKGVIERIKGLLGKGGGAAGGVAGGAAAGGAAAGAAGEGAAGGVVAGGVTEGGVILPAGVEAAGVAAGVAVGAIAAIVLAVAAAVAAIILLMKWTGHLGEAFLGAKQIILPIIDATFIKPFQIIKDIWTGDWSQLWKDNVTLFKDIFVTPFTGLWHLVHSIVATAYDSLNKLHDAFNKLEDYLWKKLLDGVTYLWKVFLDGIVKLIKSATIYKSFVHIWNLLKGSWNDLVSWFNSKVDDFGDWFSNKIKHLGIVDAFKSVWGAVKKSWNAVEDFFESKIPAFGKWMAREVGGLFDGLLGALQKPLKLILEGWNKVVGALQLDGLKVDTTPFSDAPKKKAAAPTSAGGPGNKKGNYGGVGGAEDGGRIHAVPGGVYRVAEAGHAEWVIPTDPKHRARAQMLALQAMKEVGAKAPGFDIGGAVVGTVRKAGKVAAKVGEVAVEGPEGYAVRKALSFVGGKAADELWKLIPHPKYHGPMQKVGEAILHSILRLIRKAISELAKDAGHGVPSIAKSVGKSAVKTVKKHVPHFDTGGEVGGSTGTAVPIVAHAGEWVLNKIQQSKIAHAIGKTRHWVQNYLFGAGEREAEARAAKTGSKKGHSHKPKPPLYFGPDISLADDPLSGDGDFVQFPDLGYGQISRRDAHFILQSKGIRLSKDVLRSREWNTDLSQKKLPAWKMANVVRGLREQGFKGKGLMDQAAKVYKKLEYARGGVVRAWSPPAVRGPVASFAAGGVVTTPATTGVRRPNQVNQEFQIHTESPNVDVDYVMRVAKLHAEGSF